MAEKTYLQAISDGLRTEMRRDKRVFVIGEDVGVYGGAFKVTLGFQEEFGPWRVIDAPLAERSAARGELRIDRDTCFGERGLLPGQGVEGVGLLDDFEIGRADLVGVGVQRNAG